MQNTTTTNYFPNVIGQEKTKSRLAFELDNHLRTRCAVAHMLFLGGKGDGKTNLVRAFARNLPDWNQPDKRHKRFITITGGQVKSLTQLFEDLFAKNSPTGDEAVTYFFDECHELPTPIQTALLTILEPNKNNFTSYTFRDITYNFDFRNITFLFATTEENKVFHALRDRLTDVQLTPYTTEELAQIVELSLQDKTVMEQDLLMEVARHIRINARKAVDMANNIAKLGLEYFEKSDWLKFKKQLNILPYGLNESELAVLQVLENCGESKLGTLAAGIKRPAKSVQLSIEPYLVGLGAISIEGTRKIEQIGLNLLRELRSQEH